MVKNQGKLTDGKSKVLCKQICPCRKPQSKLCLNTYRVSNLLKAFWVNLKIWFCQTNTVSSVGKSEAGFLDDDFS